LDDLQAALKLIQNLEPAGVGARNMANASSCSSKPFERDEENRRGSRFPSRTRFGFRSSQRLEMNRYPQISKKLGRPIEDLQAAVRRLSRLHPHPGKQIGVDEAPPITPDAVIYYDEDTDKYEIEMTNDPAPNLYISGLWRRYLKEKQGDKKTRESWPITSATPAGSSNRSAAQEHGFMRVIRQGGRCPARLLRQGPEFLKPLPMIHVADQLGYPRRHRSPAPSAKNGSNLPAASIPSAASSPRHHQCRRRGHELGCGEGKSSRSSSMRKTSRIH